METTTNWHNLQNYARYAQISMVNIEWTNVALGTRRFRNAAKQRSKLSLHFIIFSYVVLFHKKMYYMVATSFESVHYIHTLPGNGLRFYAPIVPSCIAHDISWCNPRMLHAWTEDHDNDSIRICFSFTDPNIIVSINLTPTLIETFRNIKNLFSREWRTTAIGAEKDAGSPAAKASHMASGCRNARAG